MPENKPSTILLEMVGTHMENTIPNWCFVFGSWQVTSFWLKKKHVIAGCII